MLDDLPKSVFKMVLIHEIGHLDYHLNYTESDLYADKYMNNFIEFNDGWSSCLEPILISCDLCGSVITRVKNITEIQGGIILYFECGHKIKVEGLNV